MYVEYSSSVHVWAYCTCTSGLVYIHIHVWYNLVLELDNRCMYAAGVGHSFIAFSGSCAPVYTGHVCIYLSSQASGIQ